MAPAPLQIGGGGWTRRRLNGLEARLEAERGQLPLWLPVALGGGISAWFLLPDPIAWWGFGGLMAALALVAIAWGGGGRAPRVLAAGAVAALVGCALMGWRADHVAAPVLARPSVVTIDGRVDRVEPLPAREIVRLRIATLPGSGLPPRLRVNVADTDLPADVRRGARVRLRARLVPPPPAGVPGGYDFARVAWFEGLGATGRALGRVALVTPGADAGAPLRDRLSAHIRSRLPGSGGGIAAALATGDEGGIADDDAEAMRRSGLAHLLSVSGLHVTAVVGATMLVMLRLLALSPWLALRVRLPVVAAGTAGLAAIGYTWLTGAEVPTVRSCIAALLVLAALAIGREAITLRLIAAGATIVLLIFPETLVGPSFQLSFAAVTAIVALHEHPRVQGWFARREESGARRLVRALGTTLLTGLAVEAALTPIALFHFHKSGLYGALANIIAIPMTTFVIMPVEAMALIADTIGLGAPFWWIAGVALDLLLAIAHATANAPGAIATLPSMPAGAFAAMIAGGLWLMLWRTRWRRWGAVPLLIGAVWALGTPPPDLVVTGDGRHLALRTDDGGLALLRARSGDYVRSILGEASGVDGAADALDTHPAARCNRDLCVVEHREGERRWRIAATRSSYLVPIAEIVRLCRDVDIIVSERRLPRRCTPRWLKLDRGTLARTGGVAIAFGAGRVTTVRRPGDRHPWLDPATVQRPRVTSRPRRSSGQ
ncbi:ComEC/Rec2 family competence protein [Sphingomonas sp. SFZ2018-12]|uniref:ComEC/Rec2 family competence protein n=1 Tax=Sphingomonas sp. SFZ2018-12 TaxID=2683197 RepID=UPI001F0DD7ED|nr:ComEC/Rec2 family competence protein [Sphingomonas sp. SFZ2018-12]